MQSWMFLKTLRRCEPAFSPRRQLYLSTSRTARIWLNIWRSRLCCSVLLCELSTNPCKAVISSVGGGHEETKRIQFQSGCHRTGIDSSRFRLIRARQFPIGPATLFDSFSLLLNLWLILQRRGRVWRQRRMNYSFAIGMKYPGQHRT